MSDAVVPQSQIELAAFDQSKYTYDDAVRLAWFWQQDIVETKQRIGRKVKWQNQKILDQMLYEATGQYNWILKSPYTMNDAEALAQLWGCTVEQAKVAGGHKIEGWLVVNAAIAAAPPETKIVTYTIMSGDTLSGIARMFSTADNIITTDALMSLNSDVIEDADRIFPGQTIRIPVG
ncbi:MAG: LysM peptidoglycan-binding domain-containing protein [Actinomycetota bacterium]